MKKGLSLLLILLTLCIPALAEEDWTLTTARELTADLGTLVRDETYQSIIGSISFDCVEALQDADFTTIKSVYRTAFSDKMLRGAQFILKLITDSSELSDVGWERVVRMVPEFLITMNNTRLGSEELAASNVLCSSQTYVMPEDFETCLLVVEADGAVVGITFVQTGEDTITVSARPLFHNEGETVDDILQNMTSLGFPCEFEKIL